MGPGVCPWQDEPDCEKRSAEQSGVGWQTLASVAPHVYDNSHPVKTHISYNLFFFQDACNYQKGQYTVNR